MFKRHSIVASIKARHCIALIALLTFIAGSQNASAQSKLAQDTYAIFEASCLNCHGPDGAYRETLLMEHASLIDGGTVIPGNPDASELYKRLLGPTENGVQMPFGQPQLPAQSIDTVRRWILGGAPDWTSTTAPIRRFISPSDVLKAIDTHVKTVSPFDRPFARYFTMTHLYNAGVPSDILGEYRKALAKLVNSLSWGLDIVNPQPIDPQQTIFYIDLRHYEWDRNAGWTEVEEAYPYHIEFNSPAQTALRNQLSRLQTTLSTAVPSVNADWFIATAASPPLYNALLSLPETDLELEDRLEVDVANNILTAPGLRVSRAGFVNSGVSNHNRVVERHNSRYGAYWKSYDFAGSVGTQNIFTHPLAFTHDGGEIIFNLPNGLQGYYLVDGTGRRLDEAPISIVSNPAASDPTVRNGLSCIGCHTEGMKEITDQVRAVIESDARPGYNKAHALKLYVENSEMDDLVNGDMRRYRRALQSTGGDIGNVEPVSRFHEAFHSPLDLSYAAASVGLEPHVFLSKIREDTGLQSAGLLVLDGGQIKRDTWRASFQDVIHALDYPQRVGEPPVVTQPEVIPGRLIEIPDPNLRALLEETLETKTFRPDVMSTLTILRAKDRNIKDLTGLEFAVNLEELWLAGNSVSDLSPIANCTKLVQLDLWGSPVEDISPIANLIKLEHIRHTHGDIRDISPVANLINLTHLTFYNTDTSDISAVSNLTKLISLRIRHSPVEDITPLAGLVNLERLDLHDCHISDISPLGNLTKLTNLTIDGGDGRLSDLSPLSRLTNLRNLDIGNCKISDLSPLAGLTQLRELFADSSEISDVSSLAGLTNLTRVILRDNRISDVSPLSGLVNLEYLDVSRNMINDITPLKSLDGWVVTWDDNPGFPGGPKIEGPWLWVTIPGENLRKSPDIDYLSKASGGTVTEVGVATHGAIEGKPVGDEKWTSHRLSPEISGDIREMFNLPRWLGVIYGCISLYSPREQNTTMYIGNDEGTKVWLNGVSVYELLSRDGAGGSYEFSFPVTLRRGNNVLLVAVQSIVENSNIGASFGFEKGTDYTVSNPRVNFVIFPTPVHVGDTFTLDILTEDIFDLAGWQFDIVFDRATLEAVDVIEGDFFETRGGSTFFQEGRIDNANGRITGLNAALLSDSGASGSGTILQVKFKAKSEGETGLTLGNFKLGSITGEIIPAQPHEIRITVEERLPTGDVNRDGGVDILDLILVARQLGQSVPANSAVDINGDGVVNIFDLTLVAQGIGGAAAPALGVAISTTIESWIAEARLADDGSIAFAQGIQNLQNLLASYIPGETALLSNYPNPFNPETWIPYQLAVPAVVTLTIYDMNGSTVRRLEIGHQQTGTYQNRSRAAYWDGRNQDGESVASGLYFYTLSAGEFMATRKMLVRK